MNTYTEFLEKAQAEFLTGLKQAQELNVKTLASVVERSFAFTSELIETRKAYALKLAELAVDAQQQFADTTKRFVETAKS